MSERQVVITGVGMVTPLGCGAGEVLGRIERGETAAAGPSFDGSAFDCPVYAPIADFDAEAYFPENKTLRLMNRDAQMAVAAAHLALQDAALKVDETYRAEEIALYGATGLTGFSVEDVTRLIKHAADAEGGLDLQRFGQVTLKRVRPVLSFKLLANMPICFVSIFENIRGENAVFTPWEGQGAQAIAAGVDAIRRGDVPCAVVGGCDVKTRIFSFISLQQLGMFESWGSGGHGCVPGEGAGFLVLEEEQQAAARHALMYARIRDYRLGSLRDSSNSSLEQTAQDTFEGIIGGLETGDCKAVVAAGDGDAGWYMAEREVLMEGGFQPQRVVYPKRYMGNLFAGAAAVQVGLAAELAGREKSDGSVLANCFGPGTEQGSFILQAV